MLIRLLRYLATAIALTVMSGGVNVATASAELAADPYAIVQKVLETHVVPHVIAFKGAAAELPPAITALCTQGDKASRARALTAFSNAVSAFAAIEFLRFGPMQKDGMREKLFFWPDPRGVLARQMRQLLFASQTTPPSTALIKQQSAALQGLPALELLLADQTSPLGPGEGNATRCALAQSISGAIADNAAALHDGWVSDGGWQSKMLRPGSDNPTYREPSEAASELVKALLVGFQLAADVQIKPRMIDSGKASGPYAASKLTKVHYAAFVASLNEFYDALGLEAYLDAEQAWVKNWADGAWRAIRSSDGVGGRVANDQRATAPSLRELFDKITGLRKLVSRELATASHLTVGFNELDGD